MRPSNVFLLFLVMNVLNYLDRYVTAGILPLLKIHFHASDAALGALGSAFMVTYALTALPFGTWADRWYPHKVAAIGVALWSLATLSSAFAWSLAALFVLRALVGVGEAAYVTTGGTILSSLFSEKKRASILSLFNLGMPIGAAAGVTLGGMIGARYGWQASFLLVGVPGLIFAYLAWRLPLERAFAGDDKRITWGQVFKLFVNRRYVLITLGYAMLSYAYGAFAWFAPTFLNRYFNYSVSNAALVMGGMTVVAGLLAPVGGWIADRWHKNHPRGRVYTLFIAMFLSAVLLFVGLIFHSLIALFFSTFFMLWQGIASALIFDVTDRRVWNTATAVALLVMHLLGDVPSTYIVGYISDKTSLLTSLAILPIPMILASFLFLASGRGRIVKSV
ncbi:MAG: hypothetical protein A2201_03580 [Alicyclobacillus sp. RIFOXYA1_FULL_53_8]|nr:MAG: hypothetical protein A2201_03580 [Alicyclobacillus sp. RIFOXYA1_FULL_53_8]